jgi:hypothetical protein
MSDDDFTLVQRVPNKAEKDLVALLSLESSRTQNLMHS